jgi:hypothetical protein
MNQFTCVHCKEKIDPKSSNALRLVTGWVKGSGKTIVHLEHEEWKFMHGWCLENPNPLGGQLFQ